MTNHVYKISLFVTSLAFVLLAKILQVYEVSVFSLSIILVFVFVLGFILKVFLDWME